MLSDAVLETARELMRQSQMGSFTPNALAMQILKLERVTAMGSSSPLNDVIELRDELETHMSERYILEAITARVMDALENKHDSREEMEPLLDALAERLAESEGDVVEQLATCILEKDHVMVVGEAADGTVEKALCEAVDTFTSTYEKSKGSCAIDVAIVRMTPDEEGNADAMAQRLESVRGLRPRVVDDVMATQAMTRCAKLLLGGVALDVDEGIACVSGSAMLCGVAHRLRVPIVVALSNLRMLPVGSRCISAMANQPRYPGSVWDYDESRDDRKREAVSIIAPAFDVVPLPRVDMIAMEFGSYAPDYIVSLIPSYEKPSEEMPEKHE